jgi:hydrogenase maturation factor
VKGDAYRRLGRGAKLAYALASLRDDPVACPGCGVAFAPAQLEAHQGRCPGMGWAGGLPAGLWLSWAALRSLGVSWGGVQRWVRIGKVRRESRAGRWVYSRIDVVAALEVADERRREVAREKKRRAAMARWYRRRR